MWVSSIQTFLQQPITHINMHNENCIYPFVNCMYCKFPRINHSWFLIPGVSLMKLPSDECHCTLLVISQHWLGAVRQQAITGANVVPDLCRHMASLGHNVLTCTSPKNSRTMLYWSASSLLLLPFLVGVIITRTMNVVLTSVVLTTKRLVTYRWLSTILQ